MQIRINVKGASRKKASIIQQVREYPDTCMTVEEFLAETVRQNVKEYNARKDVGAEKLLAGLLGEQDSVPAGIAATPKAVPPGPDASQNAEILEKQLGSEKCLMEILWTTGKLTRKRQFLTRFSVLTTGSWRCSRTEYGIRAGRNRSR